MYGSGQIGAAQANDPSPKKDTINNVAADLSRHLERLSKLGDALCGIGNRIEGVKPEPIGPQGNAETPPASMILDLRRTDQAMRSFIGRCEDETQRIAIALGIG